MKGMSEVGGCVCEGRGREACGTLPVASWERDTASCGYDGAGGTGSWSPCSLLHTTPSRLDYLLPSIALEGFIWKGDIILIDITSYFSFFPIFFCFCFYFQLVIKFPEGKERDFYLCNPLPYLPTAGHSPDALVRPSFGLLKASLTAFLG